MPANRITRYLPTNRLQYAPLSAPCSTSFVAVPAAFRNSGNVSTYVYQLAFAAAYQQVLTRRRNETRLQAYRWN